MRQRVFNLLSRKEICEWISSVDRHADAIMLCLLALVFIAGLGYSVYFAGPLHYPDEEEYFRIATNLEESGIYSSDGTNPNIFWPPGYPFLLMAALFVNHSILTLRLLNYIGLCAALGLTYLITKRHSRALFGLISVLLGIGYVVFFYTASTLFPQTIAAFLFLSILFLSEREKKLTLKTGVILGIVFGYLVLSVPSFVFLLLVFAVWRLVVDHDRVILTILLLVSFLVILPWVVRNYLTFHSITFVSVNSGLMLLAGNSELTTPNAGISVDISKYSEIAARRGLDVVETDQFYRDQALHWVLDHKIDATKLYFLKFINHFNFRNDLQTAAESSPLRDLIAGVTYLPLLGVFLLRLATFRVFKLGRFEWFLIVLYISWGLIMAIFFTRVRYRLPLDFALIIIDALFLYQVVKAFQKKMITSPSLV